MKNVLFGFVLGVLCTVVFGFLAASIDNDSVYIVEARLDDQAVLLRNVDNNSTIKMLVEDPFKDAYMVGQQIIIEW